MSKLTASDLEFAQAFNGEPDEIVTDEAYGTHLPPMGLPLETEPMHFGRSFKQAAPIRSGHAPYLTAADLCIALIGVVVIGLFFSGALT